MANTTPDVATWCNWLTKHWIGLAVQLNQYVYSMDPSINKSITMQTHTHTHTHTHSVNL